MTTSVARDTATRERAQELIRAFDGRAGSLGSLLGRVTPVDAVGVQERVASLTRRSIKKASKVWALDLAIRMMDLTTLEGKDTPGKIRALCAKGMRPQPGDPSIPHVAAICVYPTFVAEAKEALAGSGVKVASVATAFPSGQSFLDIKLAETRAASPPAPTRSTWSSTAAPSSRATTRRCSRRSSRSARRAARPTSR